MFWRDFLQIIEFLNKELNPDKNFFSVKEAYTSDNKTFVVLEKTEKNLLFKMKNWKIFIISS